MNSHSFPLLRVMMMSMMDMPSRARAAKDLC